MYGGFQETSVHNMELPYFCDFGTLPEEDLCNFTHSASSQTQFMWQFGTDSVVRFRSYYQNPGAKAELISPNLPYDGDLKCLTFKYYAYGQHVGEVRVEDENRGRLFSHDQNGCEPYIKTKIFKILKQTYPI